MSNHFLFRGNLSEANAYAAGRRELTVLHDDKGVYPRIWCVCRGRSAWADLWEAQKELLYAREATKLARRSYCFSSRTRQVMRRDARRMAEWAVAYALRAQLNLKAGLLT